MSVPPPIGLLKSLHAAAIAAAQPATCLPPHLPPAPKGRAIVIGAGKAAAAMAQALEEHWDGPLEGVVVTRYGFGVPCRHVEVIEAAHPVPDEAGLRACERVLASVGGLTEDDLVICLVSGGGSALLALPAEGLTLADKQVVTRALLRSGATIAETNCVRKHLSAIKGGRIALACAPARLVTLAISDVPGDDVADIASGPSVPDTTTCADASAVLDRYAIAVPERVRAHLASGRGETPKPGDARLPFGETRLIATPQMALEAAAQRAREFGIAAHILSDRIEGEARDVARMHAAIAMQVARCGQPFNKPCVLLSGGETTVTLRGPGRGGRNAEFMLALCDALRGHPGIYALAADTDGIDGSEDNAGAWLSPDGYARAQTLGLSARRALADNDSYGFFAALGGLVVTGPTLTNVNDFRAVLVT